MNVNYILRNILFPRNHLDLHNNIFHSGSRQPHSGVPNGGAHRSTHVQQHRHTPPQHGTMATRNRDSGVDGAVDGAAGAGRRMTASKPKKPPVLTRRASGNTAPTGNAVADIQRLVGGGRVPPGATHQGRPEHPAGCCQRRFLIWPGFRHSATGPDVPSDVGRAILRLSVGCGGKFTPPTYPNNRRLLPAPDDYPR